MYPISSFVTLQMSYCAVVRVQAMSVCVYLSIYTHKYIHIYLRTLIVLNFSHAQKLQSAWSFKCFPECCRNKIREVMPVFSRDQVLKGTVFHFAVLIL